MAHVSRRTIVGGLLLSATATPDSSHADDASDPVRDARPQPGDLLVSADTDQAAATPIRLADLKPGGPPTLAWALDPQSKLPRDGSRLNQVLLMRFDPTTLGDAEKPWSAEGVVGYSAICTHQGCTVTDWMIEKQALQCPCHQSEYDPRNGAKVVVGPALRPLPALPLKVDGNVLVVAAPFIGRVGGEKPAGS